MLHLVLGRAGSGKTEFVFSSIEKLIEKDDKKILLITPEQFSFAAERTLLSRLGERSLNRVENISFTRLADEIKRIYGGYSLPVLSKGSKAVVMKTAIEAVQPSLELYSNKATSVSFINSVISIYDEMKSCRVSVDDILGVRDNTEKELLKSKLNDLGMIIGMYDAIIKERYYDCAEELTRLYEKLLEVDYFKGKTVFIDGFSGFVAQEYKVIEVILQQADDVYITFCSDSYLNNDKYDLFSYVNMNIKILKDVAEKADIKIAEPIMLNASRRFKSKELSLLEKNIYYNFKDEYTDIPENINLYRAKNIYDECDNTARCISALLRNGYRANEIAVIVRDMDKYERELSFSFKKFNIPYFDDERQNIVNEPLIMFVSFLLRSVIYSLRSEDIFSLIKTGLTSLDGEAISLLENYVYLWSISGSKWKSDFTQSTKGFVEELSDNDLKRLKAINESREYVISKLIKFKKRCNNKTAADIAKAVYFALCDFSVSDNLKKLALALDAEGKSAHAEELSRVWELLMDILGRIASVSEDKVISVREFYKLFSLMISAEDIGVVPIGLDNVQLGSADRIRCNNPRAVFILGANEGEFPKAVIASGLLNDSDRAILIKNDFKLYSYGEALNAQERYFAYMAACSATEKLYVSYRSGTSGDSESSIVNEIKAVFPNVNIDAYSYESGLDSLESDANAFEILSSNYDKNDTFTASLKEYFRLNEEYSSRLASVERLYSDGEIKLENKELAKKLFGEDMYLSASRIDDYYNCAFRYFCKFGLGARPRLKAAMDPMQTGTVIHYVLENIIKVKGSGGLAELTTAEIRLLVDKYLKYYLENLMGDSSAFTPRFKYQFMRLSRMLVSVVERLKAEFSQSDFKAKAFELRIDNSDSSDSVESKKLKLPDGGFIQIKGAVDRVDIYEENGIKYVRVVDYKSGNKLFKLCDILYGLNLQMFIYLFTLCESDSDYKGLPAGVLYMHSARKLFNVDRSAPKDSQLEKQENDLYKMKGLVLNDSENELAKHMEKNLEGHFIPAKYSSSKGVVSGDVATLAQLGMISKKIDALIVNMGASLQNGLIMQNPVNGARHDKTCDFCDFKSVCMNKKDVKHRELEDMSNEAVIEILEKENGNA